MNFQQTLSGFKLAIDKELEHYFDIAIADAQRESELIANALEQTKKMLADGEISPLYQISVDGKTFNKNGVIYVSKYEYYFPMHTYLMMCNFVNKYVKIVYEK